jgi:hypothetical protein
MALLIALNSSECCFLLTRWRHVCRGAELPAYAPILYASELQMKRSLVGVATAAAGSVAVSTRSGRILPIENGHHARASYRRKRDAADVDNYASRHTLARRFHAL